MQSASAVIQVSASFTTDPICDSLHFWLQKLDLKQQFEIQVSESAQVLQQLLDPASESATNEKGINLFLVRLEDLPAKELEAALLDFARRTRHRSIILFCPSSAPSADETEAEASIAEKLHGFSNIQVIHTSELKRLYPVKDAFDHTAEATAQIPYSEPMFAALATLAIRKLTAWLRPPAKVLVLDADNTLWKGICAEDGISDLEMHREVQEFARRQLESGVLLALCSKNAEADVLRVFEKPDFILKREDFIGWKVNWEPKSANLHELADELNLSLSGFVFLDDNPAEIADVRSNCPEVQTILFSSEPGFVDHLWALDHLVQTREDAKRTSYYTDEIKRRTDEKNAPSFHDFLRSLELEVTVTPAKDADLPRISQLSVRTTQFNANPTHLSETDLRDLDAKCLQVSAKDRFGDYGMVGAVIYRERSVLKIDHLFLSCRALGKGVERILIRELAKITDDKGYTAMEFTITETERNSPCRDFLKEIGLTKKNRLALSKGQRLSRFSSAKASKILPRSANNAPSESWNLPNNTAHEIATSLRNLSNVKERQARPDLAEPLIKPATKAQKTVTQIWLDVLGIERVGIKDSFTTLGGKSAQLVQIYSKLKRDFETDLTLADLFQLPTIEKQAERLSTIPSASAKPKPRERSGSNDKAGDAIAIIGMALRVPGANDPEQFWENLANGVESISHFKKDELEDAENHGKEGFVPAKGIIEDIDLFDANFFGILPRDAEIMDPQQRVFLELAWEAMERAGYHPDSAAGKTGIYAGAYFDTYLLANLCTDSKFLSDLIPSIQVGSLQAELGNDKDYLATRVAYKLNLRGPAMTLQTACSTSLVSVVEACRAIRSGLCDMALAGGITLTLPHRRGYFYTEEGMLSADGHCRAFDAKASGTVFGNGAGVVMLKRVSDAVRDRDHIHAVIRGTGLNNDGGVKHSYTAPSVDGQVEVIQMAHYDAGIDPSSVSYIEAHGTGTPLGDPIEVTALTKAFGETNTEIALGSLKTNIGHLDVASGVCGLIKTALSLEKSQLPPVLHFNQSNPKIDFENSPFYVNSKLTNWKGHRRAGVSSFGVGGTNAHVVVEQAPLIKSSPSPRKNQLVLVSARSESALEDATTAIRQTKSERLADTAWTSAVGRKAFSHRRIIVGSEGNQLSVDTPSGIANRTSAPIRFLFPGQGAQHVNMAKAIYDSEPRFRRTVDQCSEILEPLLGLNLTDALYIKPDAAALNNTTLAQPAIFVIEYALADLWRSWGVEPRAMIGHSVGEFVAACHANVFDLDAGLKLLANRGKLMGSVPKGSMLSVRLSEKELRVRLPKDLDIAAINGPCLAVVSGPDQAIAKFQNDLVAEGIAAKLLHTSHAFHSRMMDAVIEPFTASFEKVELRPPLIPIISTVTNQGLTDADATDPSYWANHLRETVHFHKAVEALGSEEPEQILIEVGPGQTLTGLAKQSVNRSDHHLIVPSCKHVSEPGCDHATLLSSLGKLWITGVEIDWGGFYREETRKRVILPTYPFERKRFWRQGTLDSQSKPTDSKPKSEVKEQPSPLPLKQSAPFTRKEELITSVQEILTDLSGIPREELPGNSTFLELGFDSLLLTQVSKGFKDQFGSEVTMRQLMAEFPTIDKIVDHLDQSLPKTEASPRQDETAAPPKTIENGDVQDIVNQQLEIMRQQLSLLQGAPLPQRPSVAEPNPKALSRPPVETNSSAPSTNIDRSENDDLTPQQRQHLESLIARYTAKTRTSKDLTAKHRRTYADPRTVSGFNRLWKEIIYQIAVDSSKGSRLYDVDGNEYVDLLNGFGPNFLGHSPDFVTKALHAQLDRGVEVGPQSMTAMEVAELFCEVTGADRASFVNTGSEAVQAAMRLARTVTGRDKIVVFSKDYHGNFDEVLVRAVGDRTLPIAPGIPRRAVEDVIVLPYGTDDSLQFIRAQANDIAAVLVEPIQSRRPEFQPAEFIKELRTITLESETVLVFDEVITGFRTGLGGAQEYFGVKADIATYGKVVGGGMPIGVVAGKAKYMDTFDGGMWEYGDDSFPEKGVTFFAGTFVRHPLAMAAAKEVLLFLKEQPMKYWDDVRNRANRLAQTVDQLFASQNIPIRMVSFGSQMFVRVAENQKYANLLFFHLREKGVYLLEGFPSYLTAAHTDEDVDFVVEAFRSAVEDMQAGGFFQSEPKNPTVNQLRAPASTVHPLTDQLAEVWLSSNLGPNASKCFNEVNVLKLTGPLEVDALENALEQLVQRHEALRSTFMPDGSGFEVQQSSKLSLQVTEANDSAPFILAESEHQFDLANGPLLRAHLVKIAEENHELILNAHHIICDGWSFNILTNELSYIYAKYVQGKNSDLPAPRQLTEFSRQNRTSKSSEAFWLAQFKTAVPPLQLPRDFSPQVEPDFKGETITEVLDNSQLRELKQVAGKSGATLFAVLLSAWQTLLYRVANQKRMVIGIPAAGQNSEGNESLVGHAVNFLPLVGTVEPDEPFSQLVGKVQKNVLDALDHQEYTYGKLLEKIDRGTRIEAVFNLERMDSYDEFEGLESIYDEAPRHYVANPLFLKAIERKNGLDLRIDFQTALFNSETVRHWLAAYRAILEHVIATPDAQTSEAASSLAHWQRKQFRDWNQTETSYPKKTAFELFKKTADLRPQAVALRTVDEDVCYQDLLSRIESIASQLSISPGERIAIFLERSPDLIATVFAVLRGGGVYVPLDPEYPSERLLFMMKESKATVLVCNEQTAKDWPSEVEQTVVVLDEKKRTQSARHTGDPSDPAYIMFTSGSTGTPKAWTIPHRAIVRLVRDTNYCEFGEDEMILQAASVCFDAATFEIFGSLLNGGTLVLPPAGRVGTTELGETIRRQKVTTLFLTAGLFQLMVDEEIHAFANVRQLIAGGDIVSTTHAEKILTTYPKCRLTNGYGPTENTTFTTAHTISTGDLQKPSLPIGKPISNTMVSIVGPDGTQVPVGVPGELCTRGDGLALEFSKEGIYRTGDLCRYLADGTIEFIARIGQQVKIRGYRVEPGEIEAVLQGHPKVRQCRILVRGKEAVTKSLVAYIAADASSADLMSYLRKKLPSYLVPSSLIVMESLPLNENGKIDVKSLRETTASPATTLPPSKTELELARLWKTILNLNHAAPEDNFFEVGGHSLLGMKLFSGIQRKFGVNLPLATLFRASTIRQLASVIDEKTSTIEAAETLVAIQPAGDAQPLFSIHGGDGGVLFYAKLAEMLGERRPFHAFEAPSLSAGGEIPDFTVEEIATTYLTELRKAQQSGPYLLCGYSFGGVVAYEMAVQLTLAGEDVAFVGLLDTQNPALVAQRNTLKERVRLNWENPIVRDVSAVRKLSALGKRVASGLTYRLKGDLEIAAARSMPPSKSSGWLRQAQIRDAHERAMNAYEPPQWEGKVTLFRAETGNDKFDLGDDYGWSSVARGGVQIVDVPGNHISMFHKQNLPGMAKGMKRVLDAI